MSSSQFNDYKVRYRAAIRKVLGEAEPGRLDEAGFPAYSHPNAFINWLFWERLHKAMDYIQRNAPYERVLDFGCGSGVMLPFLSENSKQVVAMDVDLVPLERIRKYIPLAANVEVHDGTKTTISDLRTGPFDFILALDVLEHVKDLPRTLNELLRLLKTGGQLIVSGPTENSLYQIGRKLAGPEYSGDYHERGISEIRSALARQCRVERIAALYWPVPLFEILTATI